MSELKRIPQHVAIIMDGNGRWAELRGLERCEGHAAGVEPVRASLRAAARHGVKFLTLYAFSTENWGRPSAEVDALSNFLLWQASYAELWFPGVLWPDFNEEEFDKAIDEYAHRDRRFGLVKGK